MARRGRVLDNWERLVIAASQRTHLSSSSTSGAGGAAAGLAGAAPSSLGGRAADIDRILQAANEIEEDDPNVARILCESAFTMAQELDPSSEGRGVLQFKTALMSVIKTQNESPQLARGASDAVYQLYDAVTHTFLTQQLREEFDTWHTLAKARNEGRLFQRINWPKDPQIKELVKRLHLLLTVKESAANIPKNLEAGRRLQFFTNSLFMDMPVAKPVSEMVPFR